MIHLNRLTNFSHFLNLKDWMLLPGHVCLHPYVGLLFVSVTCRMMLSICVFDV